MLNIVQTNSGQIRGYPGNNQWITVFKGIPYAKAPVGELRWKPPQKIAPWEGIFDAAQYGNIPWQPRFSSEGGNTLAAEEFYIRNYPRSEDCLYLNIFTPAKTQEEKLPVCIYIHGGGFATGYSYLNAYDGESFAKEGIVFVTIGYRLNLFGFLATEELAQEHEQGCAGNYGLMDQIEALKWVRENISYFGGDPDSITLMGQSAGGVSVEHLCQSKLSRFLIKGAIMQSGGGLYRGGAFSPLNKQEAFQLGEEFFRFLEVNNVQQAREMEAEVLLKRYEAFVKERGLHYPFQPIVDGYVLEQMPHEAMKSQDFAQIPYLIGCTADEMRNRHRPETSPEEQKQWAIHRFGEVWGEEYISAVAKQGAVPARYEEDPVGNELLAGCVAFCKNQKRLQSLLVFTYFFQYTPPGAEEIGAHHSVEHHYVFRTLSRSHRNYGIKDYALALQLSNLWSNFIKYGTPGWEWEAYKTGEETLVIGEEVRMEKLSLPDNIDFMVNYFLGEH